MVRALLCLFGVATLLVACNRPQFVDLSEPTPFPASVAVQQPMTAAELAGRFGVETADLVRLNPWIDPAAALPAGTVIQMPRPRTHQVVAGDTIWRLSNYYGTTPDVLAALNNLYPPYTIGTGDRVRLPLRQGQRPQLAQAPITPPLPGRTPVRFGTAGGGAGLGASVLPSPTTGLGSDTVSSPPPAFSSLSVPQRPSRLAAASPPSSRAPGIPSTPPGLTPPRIPPRLARPSSGSGVEPASPSTRLSATPAARSPSPFAWPVSGPVISGFGPKPGGLHNDGINIAVAEGTPITASAPGEVVYAGNQLRGFGNLVLIRHAGGWVTAYAHASVLWVETGARVAQGQRIGAVGQTGSVSSPQLHFQIREDAVPVDPRRHLPSV